MNAISVLGATTWGNTISHLLTGKGYQVKTWAKTEAKARELNNLNKKTPLLVLHRVN